MFKDLKKIGMIAFRQVYFVYHRSLRVQISPYLELCITIQMFSTIIDKLRRCYGFHEIKVLYTMSLWVEHNM